MGPGARLGRFLISWEADVDSGQEMVMLVTVVVGDREKERFLNRRDF